jgi:hypothetical protein
MVEWYLPTTKGNTMNKSECVTISAGRVEYDINEAAVSIDDMIDMLESAKSEGATHVVGTSGNYRGAQWIRLGRSYDWADDDGEY